MYPNIEINKKANENKGEENSTRKFLIVVDMQHDFIDGVLGSDEAKLIVNNVKEKIQEYYRNGDGIIFTRDTHDKNYLTTNEGKNLPFVHCVKGTYGWNIIPGLEVSGCEYIDKPSFGWNEYYFEDANIELIGVCTDICVVSNALIIKALFPEANIMVDASCCAGTSVESHNAALLTMEKCQINVIGK